MGSTRKVVWILGAGFSVPLGGPLFRSLISGETLRTLRGWDHYVAQTHSSSIRTPGGTKVMEVPAESFSRLICALYEAGLASPGATNRLWGDAEEFIDRLAIASESNSMLANDVRECVSRLGKSWHDQADATASFDAVEFVRWQRGLMLLHMEALRFIGGACTAFLLRAGDNPKVVDESEQWEPYRRWFRCLEPGSDEVMSFNYDRAPDLLAAYGKRQRHSGGLFITPVEHTDGLFDELKPNCVPLYHLHGHVGWKLTEGGRAIAVDTESPNGIAYIYPDRAVIGIPGRHKLMLPTGLLKNTWDSAMKAIETADAVVLVGYRFPETDNLAKRRLIDALKKNPRAMVHVVLGANNPDTPRVQAMLEWTRQKDRVRVHPLWAQDFLAVFERDGLFES